ncbi:unnamed protein product [Chironomus riparius]|uniref:E2F/DP family winged-helix DNA-binding domain-containing protein n=1 Tax=Chironomus riparius TaxID=315576 RepID=A0A9P0IZM8_9DIPT|nr:unnamed protein product [Chironomus riparius]
MNESRKDKSLYTLTKKFVEMLKTEETVDLNIVTNELQCAKKRRIYDVSNVLEGIGLIKKTQKNLYQYTGKTNKNDSILDHEKLSNLKNEKESLESLEKELDKNIYNMEMNNASLRTQDSYLYLTRQDFINAFSKNRSILLLKDYKNIRVIVEDPEATNCSSIHVLGFIVKPVTCKLVNNENSDKPLPTIENLDIDSISNNNNDIDFVDPKMFDSHKELKKSDDVILFKRSIRPKSFLETDSLEYEKLSENILSHDQYEDKSKFYYNRHQYMIFLTVT